jgi:hypothetical protein
VTGAVYSPGTGEAPLRALGHFATHGTPLACEPLRVGLIHASYVATCRRAGGGTRRFLLQRLNTRVFAAPERVMENIQRVTAHLRRRVLDRGDPEPERRVLRPVPSEDGRPWHVDEAGDWWRAYDYVEGAVSHDHPDRPETAQRAAAAYGGFLADLADLPGPPLHETVPGFHDTPARYLALLDAVDRDPLGRAREVREPLRRLEARRETLETLERAAARGELTRRVVHNDTKLNNVLFDLRTGEAVCVVDLDTVMPGLALHDYGDLVRSAARSSGEDARDPGAMRLDLALHAEATRGWLGPLAALLRPAEVALLPLAPRVIALELAIRFLTDYLEGDRYFRIEHEGHNLARCRAQLALAEDMERKEDAMAAVARAALGG